jgi:prefoldin subunit 5
MRFGGYPSPYGNADPETEKQALGSQAEALQAELDLIKKRLDEIEASTAAE